MSQNHVITIDQEVETMITQIKKSPKLLQKSAGKDSCCIFRVPQSLVGSNKELYQPRLVSIGPYHHGNKDLEMIQEHKWRFLGDMITRTAKPLAFFMNKMVSMEKEIRESYSESIDRFGTNELAKMMVLDGVFLIELFRKVGKLVHTLEDDPIFKMRWFAPFFMKDLLKIENQIPFFVLDMLYKESKHDNDNVTLQSLILKFFKNMLHRKPEVLSKCEDLKGKHLLDIIRMSFTNTRKGISVVSKAPNSVSIEPNSYSKAPNSVSKAPDSPPTLIQPATKLDIVGIKFKLNHQANSFLDIEYQNKLLLVPQILIDEFTVSLFVNCMTFEQCYCDCSQDITAYLLFLSCLINSSTDVDFFVEKKIINNYLGPNNKEIANFFNEFGKGVAIDMEKYYLKDLFIEINEHSEHWWYVRWGELKHTYFRSPWASISVFAAFIGLSLTALQAFYAVYS